MDHDDLERLAGDRLSRLPEPQAPETLLPRVMAAVARAARPWYARAWWTWPVGWQVASAAALLVLVAGLGLLAPSVGQSVYTVVGSEIRPVVEPVASGVATAGERLRAWSLASQVFLRVLQPVATVLLGLMLVMCATCVAFGAVVNRVTFGGALRL